MKKNLILMGRERLFGDDFVKGNGVEKYMVLYAKYT